MQDAPRPGDLLDAVIAFLRDVATPELRGAAAYHARVAANALEIARRDIDRSASTNDAELASLQALLGVQGESLAALNRLLCERIAEGALGLDSPGLVDHLWRITLDKLAVDQPGYAAYRRIVNQSSTEA
jgi:hypothetical protein